MCRFSGLIFVILLIDGNHAAAGRYGKLICTKVYDTQGKCNQGLKVCDKKCNDGDNDACRFLGCVYEMGDGVKKNYKAAFRYNKIACKRGHGPSCGVLGAFYERGAGIKRDPKKAHEYTIKSCEMKCGGSCHVLGARYLHGTFGYSKDFKKALYYLTEACALDPQKCGNLALMYEKGVGVEKDLARALKIRERSCSVGDDWVAEYCCQAAKHYLAGATGKREEEPARRLLKVACGHGHPEACYILCTLVTNDEIFNAEKVENIAIHCELDIDEGKAAKSNSFGCKALLCLEQKHLLGKHKENAEKLLCRAGYAEMCSRVQDRVLGK